MPPQRWKPRGEQLPMKPRTDSEQWQRRLYTHLGTVAGRAEGNWIIYAIQYMKEHGCAAAHVWANCENSATPANVDLDILLGRLK